MAEFIGIDEVETELAVRVSLNYEEFYLSREAAESLRDELTSILNRL
jgi:hypothetical protein